MMLFTVGLVAYVIFVCAFILNRKERKLKVIPSDFFVFFFVIAWSPATFIDITRTHIPGVNLGDAKSLEFTIAYIIMCFMIFLGYVFGKRTSASLGGGAMNVRQCGLLEARRLAAITVAVAICVLILYLSSSGLRGQVTEIYSFVTSSSFLTYNEMRRETLREGFIMQNIYPRFQYSISFLLFCVCAVMVSRSKTWSNKLFFLIFCVAIFFVCAATFKKFPYVYYLLSFLVASALWKSFRNESLVAFVRAGAYSAVISSGLLILLITVQYQENTRLDFWDLIDTLVFRVTSAYPDGFKLYLLHYPDQFEYAYGRSASFLQPIFGAVEHPAVAIPEFYGMNTSFPSGFVASAYADFGWIGICLYSFFVGWMILYLDRFAESRKRLETQVLAVAVIGMQTVHVWALPFTTSLVTGGLALSPLLIYLLESAICSRKQRSFPYRVMDGKPL